MESYFKQEMEERSEEVTLPVAFVSVKIGFSLAEHGSDDGMKEEFPLNWENDVKKGEEDPLKIQQEIKKEGELEEIKYHSEIDLEEEIMEEAASNELEIESAKETLANIADSPSQPASCSICHERIEISNNLIERKDPNTCDACHCNLLFGNICKYCKKAFSCSSRLLIHLQKHTGEKPFTCKYCNKGFSHSGTMQSHLRLHTGEKPFICKYCQKRYSESRSLNRHLKSNHESKAKEHLTEAEVTPNLESVAEGNKKRPRKVRKIILPGEEYSSSDTEIEDVIRPCRRTKPFSKSKIRQFPLPPSHNRPPASSTPPPCPFISLPLAIDIPRTSSQSSASSGNSSSSHTGSELLQLKRSQELMWNVLGELTKTSERLEKKMDKILSILEAQPSQPLTEAPESASFEEQLFAHLPLKVEDVDAFEEKLKEPAVKQSLIKCLLAVAGKDVKLFAANLMKRLFIDEIGEKYSLTGKAGKESPGKKPFMKTRCFHVVYYVCLRKFQNAQESQIRESVSDWLMQAKFRKLRRENRKQKNSAERGNN